jgi:hypothetical protein
MTKKPASGQVDKNGNSNYEVNKWLKIGYYVFAAIGGLAAFILCIDVVFLKSTSKEILQYKEQYWPAPKTPAVHDGLLKILVIDNKTRTPQELERVFVLCSIGQMNRDAKGVKEIEIPIGDCSETEINIKLVKESQWLADRPQYVPYGEKSLVLDKYTILVNGINLNITNVGRSGKSFNYFIDLIKE